MALTLDDLIAALPRVNRIALDKGKPKRGVDNEFPENPLFVSPDLRVERPIVPDQTSVVLVEAPAAVGKSVLAREIARRCGALLCNLAELNVGNYFLGGLVQKSFGASKLSAIMDSLQDGDFLIVLDALDEARLRAGDDNFGAFLEDLCDHFRQPRKRPSLLLLGRAKAVEFASLYLEAHLDPGVPFAHVEIEYFQPDAAKQFIDQRLDSHYGAKGEPSLHRQARQEFEAARDAVFSCAVEALGSQQGTVQKAWDKEEVKSFLGYAPILVGVAEYLAERDQRRYFTLAEELRGTTVNRGPTGVWELFVKILDSILNREHDKVLADGVRSKLAPAAATIGWKVWDMLYLPFEQRVRVLAQSSLKLDHKSLPAQLPEDLRDQYEEAIGTQVQEHPYLGDDVDGFASVVFREDTYAWLLSARDAELEQKAQVRERLKQRDYLPSPLLSHSLFARSSAAGGLPTIDSADLGFAYESVCSQVRKFEEFELSVDEQDDGYLLASLVKRNVDQRPIDFRVKPNPEGIFFPRRLANAAISVSVPVTLGTEDSSFFLGPTTNLTCSRLRIAAGDLRVNTGSGSLQPEQRYVTLTASECEHGFKPPQVEGEGKLKIWWPSPKHNWARYAADEPVSPPDNRSQAVLGALRQIVVAFNKADPGGRFTRAKAFIDGHVIQNAPLRMELLDFLISKRLIRSSAADYELDRDAIAELQIHLGQLRIGIVNPQVRSLLDEFAQRPSKRAK